jgi:hypothetical protein
MANLAPLLASPLLRYDTGEIKIEVAKAKVVIKHLTWSQLQKGLVARMSYNPAM